MAMDWMHGKYSIVAPRRLATNSVSSFTWASQQQAASVHSPYTAKCANWKCDKHNIDKRIARSLWNFGRKNKTNWLFVTPAYLDQISKSQDYIKFLFNFAIFAKFLEEKLVTLVFSIALNHNTFHHFNRTSVRHRCQNVLRIRTYIFWHPKLPHTHCELKTFFFLFSLPLSLSLLYWSQNAITIVISQPDYLSILVLVLCIQCLFPPPVPPTPPSSVFFLSYRMPNNVSAKK